MIAITRYNKLLLQEEIRVRNMNLSDFEFNTINEYLYSITFKNINNFNYTIDSTHQRESNFIKVSFDKGYSNETEIIMFNNYDEVKNSFAMWLNQLINEIAITLHEETLFTVSDTVNAISPKFLIIFNQSVKATQLQLDEIAGMGFRKSFEFLLKDYLIFKGEITEEFAQTEFKLQKVIDKLSNKKLLHDLATYISYLGNDFAHYYRKYEQKEIKDLKEGIQILINWIDTTELHEVVIENLEKNVENYNNNF